MADNGDSTVVPEVPSAPPPAEVAPADPEQPAAPPAEASSSSSSSSNDDIPGKRLQCYLWGSLDFAKSWNSNNELIVHWPMAYTALNDLKLPIKSVSSGAKHTMIVTTDGRVFGFGNNAKGQLGSDKHEWAHAPIQVLPEKGLVYDQAACGTTHTLLLTKEGKVWSFGHNFRGQLGNRPKGGKDATFAPARVCGAIEFLKIVQVAAGTEISYALSDAGDVYSWGAVGLGQMGHGTDGKTLETAGVVTYADLERPMRMEWFVEQGHKIKQIACGNSHLLVLTTDGKLFTCGHGAYGRLGQGTDTHDKLTPVQVTWWSRRELKITDISCGAENSMCLCETSGYVFVYFWGRPGKDDDGVMTPHSIDDLCGNVTVKQITGGKGMTMVATVEGEAAIWGDNQLDTRMGLLGLQKSKKIEPKLLALLSDKHAEMVSCGGWHVMVFVDPERSKGPVDIVVPQEGRALSFGGTPSVGKPYEENVALFRKKCQQELGQAPAGEEAAEENGNKRAAPASAATSAAKKQKASPKAKAAAKPKAKAKAKAAPKPKAAPKLKSGTKVKVWFEDTYVPGKIAKVVGDNKFLMKWDKEGWKDEEVELNPEDMTDDPANIERWQLL
eukprot:NODE_970_length_1964_cov_103.461706_g920_i0.p1 GENE.NODE_970_length_1964_cov_103.461706_g920_i0~~NODE_970_length_1964_cov_103.461706_g920_i0.p1  ORF type:complete len:628 (-),score=143.83 NODE_970_length_1964_cov_103.461706_g920_i0:81-1913(-)